MLNCYCSYKEKEGRLKSMNNPWNIILVLFFFMFFKWLFRFLFVTLIVRVINALKDKAVKARSENVQGS